MLLSALALSVGLFAPPMAAMPAAPLSEGTVVYLGCQVSNSALTDCKVVNHEPVDAETASVALKLAQAMTVPAALSDRSDQRIVVKLNVRP